MTIGIGVILTGVLLIALIGLAATATAGSSATGGTPAPSSTGGTGSLAKNTGALTSKQQQFAGRLQADTGLDPGVIAAWLLAEENGGAAQARDTSNNNDWLNIGYTDSATLGAGNSVWTDPVAAADATAAWIHGTWADPGFGKASSGIQAILNTVGQGAQAQIRAIQGSGWASSGYPSLLALFQEVTA